MKIAKWLLAAVAIILNILGFMSIISRNIAILLTYLTLGTLILIGAYEYYIQNKKVMAAFVLIADIIMITAVINLYL
ncbi:MAG: hypothetical protein RR539_04365 [Clostridium sp.]|uniref:hypothetical protein n=1 Tax=Clostridium sp. TaxID=1506 RepID=UPI002FCB035F